MTDKELIKYHRFFNSRDGRLFLVLALNWPEANVYAKDINWVDKRLIPLCEKLHILPDLEEIEV